MTKQVRLALACSAILSLGVVSPGFCARAQSSIWPSKGTSIPAFRSSQVGSGDTLLRLADGDQADPVSNGVENPKKTVFEGDPEGGPDGDYRSPGDDDSRKDGDHDRDDRDHDHDHHHHHHHHESDDD